MACIKLNNEMYSRVVKIGKIDSKRDKFSKVQLNYAQEQESTPCADEYLSCNMLKSHKRIISNIPKTPKKGDPNRFCYKYCSKICFQTCIE